MQMDTQRSVSDLLELLVWLVTAVEWPSYFDCIEKMCYGSRSADCSVLTNGSLAYY
jgi:hypothetical protein